MQYEVYGVRRNIANSETTWERIEANYGKVANAVTSVDTIDTTINDFDNIYPWSDIKSCDISADSTINAYIDDPTYDPVNPTGYIMTEFPEFYWNREQKEEDGATYEYIYISRTQTEFTPNRSKKFYVGRYRNDTSSVLKIASGVTPNTTASDSFSNVKQALLSGASKFCLYDISVHSLIQMLYLVEYADYNSQNKLGKGSTTKLKTGTLDSLKMKSGSLNPTSNSSGVIYRGVENLYRSYCTYLAGVACYPFQKFYYTIEKNKLATEIFQTQGSILITTPRSF